MKTRTLTILAAVTAAAVAAAFFATRDGAATAGARAEARKLFPDLAARVNDVAEVEISRGETRAHLRREGEAWGAVEKSMFPVDMAKLRPLVVGIADFTVVGEMTKNPSGYEKLGVEDPTGPDGESKRVTLKDAGGNVLADVIVGKPRASQGFGGRPSLYVRPFGAEQALEVTGSLTVTAELSSWLVREIAKLDSTRVARVAFTHPDGETLVVSKSKPEDKDFTVEAFPAGAELAWPGVANGLANALQWLSMEDAQRAEGFDLTGAAVAEYTTFDGMLVTAKTVEKDGKTWLALSAAYDEARRYRAPEPEAAEPEPEGEAPEAPAEEKQPDLKSAHDVAQEVEAFNHKHGPWVYAIPGYTATNFRKRMVDLVKKPSETGLDLEGDASSEEPATEPDALPVAPNPTAEDPAKDEVPAPEIPPAEPPADTPPTPPQEEPKPPQEGGGC